MILNLKAFANIGVLQHGGVGIAHAQEILVSAQAPILLEEGVVAWSWTTSGLIRPALEDRWMRRGVQYPALADGLRALAEESDQWVHQDRGAPDRDRGE